MIIDDVWNLGLPTITNSNTATASTNVVDVGSAKIIFQAGRGARIWGRAAVSVDTTSLRVDFVGSAAAALTTPFVIASRQIAYDELNALLGTGTQTITFDFEVSRQRVAYRHYGLLVTLGGTNPDMTAGSAYLVFNAQTNMIGAQAAIPAT